ncbi:MAG: S-layer homology domain-containing protein [Faecousia sp.]
MKNTIKRLLAAALVCCMVLGALPFAGFAATAKDFGDVTPNSWFYEDVRFVCEKGLMIGTSDQTFSPNVAMSRAMLTTVLYRLAGSPAVEAAVVFADVPTNQWYSDAITWASEDRVVEGYGNDLFGPNDPITREQLVTMLYQYAGKTGSDITESEALDSFNDATEVHEWALDAMQWAYAAGVVIGRSSQRLAPQASATRAEAAAMLHRFLEKLSADDENSGNEDMSAAEPSDPTRREVSLDNLTADEIYFSVDETARVTFTVSCSGECDDVYLMREDGGIAGTMHDDGSNGDFAAYDGIYSLTIEEEASAATTLTFYAEADTALSNLVNIYFFKVPDASDAEKAEAEIADVQANLARIQSEYIPDGIVSDTTDLTGMMVDITEYLDTQCAAGVILYYEVEECYVYMKFCSGLTLAFEPVSEGTSTGGTEVSLTIISYQPNPDAASPWLVDCLTGIGDYSGNCSYSTESSKDGAQVTLDVVKTLGANQVIVWNGHGGYGPIVKSYLATGETFRWSTWVSDEAYRMDCVKDRVIVADTPEQRNLAGITSKFIDYYCGSMDNSLIMLCSCHSGQESRLSNAFLNKGATAVLGFSNTVYSGYCEAITGYTLAHMTGIDPRTNQYRTLSASLEMAKTEQGKDDREWAKNNNKKRIKWSTAEPVIFGGAAAENYCLANSTVGTLAGRICKASDRTSPIGAAEIEVYSGDTLFISAKSDDDGAYSITLPAGSYRLQINANGYLPFQCYITVTANETTYTETFLMVEGDEQESGIATGTVYNALTGTGIAGVTVIARAGWNNTSEGAQLNLALQTDASGKYSITLPLGNYTLELTKDGYISTYINIIVQSGTTADQNGTMSPVITGDSFRIVLSWGANPSDLDSHVEGMRTNGTRFHVYYADKYAYDGDVRVCDLDVDDTTSYGPETITLNTTTEEPYYYYVHKYAGNGTLPTSEAKVRVYQGEALIAEYNVPTDLEAARYWNVFAIVNGQIVTRNTMTSAPELHYAE